MGASVCDPLPRRQDSGTPPMTIPNLHDHDALREVVAAMATEEIVDGIREGGLSAFAEEIAMDELARRVLTEEVDYGQGARSRESQLLDRASKIFATVVYLVWFAWALGFVHWIVTGS
jgi:hypothetical protein